MERKSYVYIYLDHTVEGPFVYGEGQYTFDYLPMYVGKGKNGRSHTHLNSAKMIMNKGTHKNNTLVDRIAIIEETTGFPPKIIKVWEKITDEEALYEERKLIRAIGTREAGGPLYNKISYDMYNWKPLDGYASGTIFLLNHPYVKHCPIGCLGGKDFEKTCGKLGLDKDTMNSVARKQLSEYRGWTVEIM